MRRRRAQMLIGGLQKSSLIDFRGKIAAVVFLQGCNFYCPYCHNPELVIPMLLHPLSKENLFSFLKTRINKLDGVVISGGEPTIHKDLPEFIREIKNMGFLIKLDTNGTNPIMLEKLINEKLVDYAAMDIKTSLDEYKKVVRREINISDILKSMKILAEGKIDYEFRTTVVKGLLTFDNFSKINDTFKTMPKIKRYYLQKFQKSKHIDEAFLNAETFEDDDFQKLKNLFKETVEFCMVR